MLAAATRGVSGGAAGPGVASGAARGPLGTVRVTGPRTAGERALE